jgi:methyl-accepting chemotaxis protein
MTEVVSSIRRMTNIMDEISAAGTKQSQGMTQVGEAVTQMDQVTQQNAALAEQMAAAAFSLNTQAQDLVGTVAVFKLSQFDNRLAPALPVATPARARPAATVTPDTRKLATGTGKSGQANDPLTRHPIIRVTSAPVKAAADD